MDYAIEMYDGWDVSSKKHGQVHRAGCRDLRDPEPLGTDWQAGVSRLGSDWELDVEEGMVVLAPCAR